MAAPIAHIVCALVLLNSGSVKVDNVQEFIIGTSFPDIRYLGVIEREKTHLHNLTLNDIKNAPTSFEQGRLLHSLLDEVREEFVEEHELYRFVNNTRFRSQILKFYEDMQLYPQIDDWRKISTYFDVVLPEEEAYGIKKEDIQTWHAVLKQYCAQRPTVHTIESFLQQRTDALLKKERSALKRFWVRSREWIKNKLITFVLTRNLKKLDKEKKVKTSINHFYKNVAEFLSQR
jgi:hypothetical protein